MGIKASTIGKAMRDKLGIALSHGGHAERPFGPAIPVWLKWDLDIDPPTVTHHSKHGGGQRMTLVDDDALRAARRLYESVIPVQDPTCPVRVPVLGPLAMTIVFTFYSSRAGMWVRKPDIDNSATLLIDVLADRGYVYDDSGIAILHASKFCGPVPSVFVYLRTIQHLHDDGGVLDWAQTRKAANGEMIPAPWVLRNDAAHARKLLAKRTPAVAPDPGSRRPDWVPGRRGTPESQTQARAAVRSARAANREIGGES